jgi:heat shock protein HtpX
MSREPTLMSRLGFVVSPPSGTQTGFFERVLLALFMGSDEAWVARPAEPLEAQTQHQLAELSAKKGIETPKLIIYESARPNAASILGGSIVMSGDLLRHMTEDEVKAVLGHELAHHTHAWRDRFRLLGIGLGVAATNELALLPALDKQFPKLTEKTTFKTVNTVGMLAADLALLSAMQRRNELEADAESARLIGSSRPMIDALHALSDRVQHLEIEDQKKKPVEPRWLSRIKRAPLAMLPTHPPTEARIARLELLEQAMQQQEKDHAGRQSARRCETCPPSFPFG